MRLGDYSLQTTNYQLPTTNSSCPMIKYSVQCQHGHGFEAWFQNSGAFDTQTKRGLVSCPDCGSVKVTKALMAPNISARTRKKGVNTADAAPKGKRSRASDSAPASTPAAALPERVMPPEMLELMRKIRTEVEAKAENVGTNFAEEARKMHYNEAPERGIYGEASLDDVRALHDEGIDCLPLPVLPEDRN